MNKQVEVEGGELALRNSNGDIAIIPKKYRREVEDMIKDNCHGCLDKLIATLPKASDYAEGGSLYEAPIEPDDPSIAINVNNPVELAPIDIVADKNTKQDLPYYSSLSNEEKKMMEGTNPMSRNIRHKARVGKGFDSGDVENYIKAMTLGSLDAAGRTMQVPQSVMVEGIEQLRGNPYNYSNALPKYTEAQSSQRMPSDTFLKDSHPVIQFIGDIGLDPTNISGAGLIAKSKGVGKTTAKAGSKVLNETADVVKQATSSVDDVTKKPWQLEELPGLHLKSTMEGQAISKIVEPKTGLVNVEQALAIIGKESGGADKVALIKQGLGETLPKKMDYNEFRKVVQDQLIPLERQFSSAKSDYGIDRLGYNYGTVEENIGGTFSVYGNPRKFKTRKEAEEFLKPNSPIENQTLILGNKGKFGRGSSAHGNPEETLGHAHFLRDKETPDVLTVTQIQSDAFQGTHRIMPDKTINSKIDELKQHLTPEGRKLAEEIGGKKAADLNEKAARELIEKYEKDAIEALGPNPTQKQLLDKNHQERYLQELVDYAGKRGDVNKIRVPTSETAAKVQGYNSQKVLNRKLYDTEVEKLKNSGKYTEDEIRNMSTKLRMNPDYFTPTYSSEHQTILKKYSEQPKTIKKLFGVEPKVVTDSKGNTWYEFDIPKKFKEGKGEIKALGLIPPAVVGGTLLNKKEDK